MWYGGSVADDGSAGLGVLKLRSNFMGLTLAEDGAAFASLVPMGLGWLGSASAAASGSSFDFPRFERTREAGFATGEPKEISAAFLVLLDEGLVSALCFDSSPASSSELRDAAATDGEGGSNPGGGPVTDDTGLAGFACS